MDLDVMYKIAGVTPEEVKKWQKAKNFTNLSERAALQLYTRVVLKRTLRPPFKVYEISELWKKINDILEGREEMPSSGKLFVGIKGVVVGLTNSITYMGCPKCKRSQRNIGATKCVHDGKVYDFEELTWTEWIISGDESDFSFKMPPEFSEYNEFNMTGAYIWVEGVVKLTSEPIQLIVSRVLDFKPGSLLLPDGDEVDYSEMRDEVDLAGFDDDEDDGVDDILLVDDDESETVEVSSNGTSSDVSNFIVEEFDEVMGAIVSNPIKRAMVERYIIDRVNDVYPNEFDSEESIKKKLWELVDGRYKVVDKDRIMRGD